MAEHLLTRKMADVLANIRRANRAPFHALGARGARQAYEAAAEILEPPRAALDRVEDIRIPTADGASLRASVYASSSAVLPALLHMHGGGFTIGSLETHDSLCRHHAGNHGIRRHTFAPALRTRLSARCRKHRVVLRPVHRIRRPSRLRFAPLEANDLDGVAPACVVLAECDPLVDAGLAYADRLRAAGVRVELELARGVTHDFIKLGRVLPEAAAAQAMIGAALRRAFDLNDATEP